MITASVQYTFRTTEEKEFEDEFQFSKLCASIDKVLSEKKGWPHFSTLLVTEQREIDLSPFLKVESSHRRLSKNIPKVCKAVICGVQKPELCTYTLFRHPESDYHFFVRYEYEDDKDIILFESISQLFMLSLL